jgi:PPK2 family polyphosphate:nucleotide phosphotransferase
MSKGKKDKGKKDSGKNDSGKRGKVKDGGKSKVAGLDATKASDKGVPAPASFADALRVEEGFILADLDTRSTPGFDGDKAAGEEALAARAGEISQFQERLYAESKGPVQRSLLLVVQGMDTSGKGGIMRHVVGQMDPQGVKYTAFKAPSAEERAHPFLWRIRNALPSAGQVGVFDRSQYEDVLIVRVHELVPRATWSRRYSQINDFEAKAVADGTTIVKVMLNISSDEQKARLTERLEREDKHWKYNPGDVDERLRWPEYQAAYQAVLEKTSTEAAPWFVVPADRKWYRNWAVTKLLVEQLEEMGLAWPQATYDVEDQRTRLLAMP